MDAVWLPDRGLGQQRDAIADLDKLEDVINRPGCGGNATPISKISTMAFTVTTARGTTQNGRSMIGEGLSNGPMVGIGTSRWRWWWKSPAALCIPQTTYHHFLMTLAANYSET